ncbi:hypothetical protein MBLNU459_g4214t2 [Dothideomycetes sp. NU459]
MPSHIWSETKKPHTANVPSDADVSGRGIEQSSVTEHASIDEHTATSNKEKSLSAAVPVDIYPVRSGDGCPAIPLLCTPPNDERLTTSESKQGDRGASARQSVPLAPDCYRFARKGDSYVGVDQVRIRNIPTSAIGFIDLANAGDFAANVFNEIPVPWYAIVLMALGATAAGIMSLVAWTDGRQSWKNICNLRQERRALRATVSDITKADHSLLARLDLNRRDYGTEVFDRAGMELALGFAALLVCVGTYMAIDGADRKVWFVSNLLSGYIGNAPAAAFGLINSAWSWHVWSRASKQRQAARSALDENPVRDALLLRIRTVQKHAVLTGVVCLISGAMSMLTPTRWWPYPILLVCGLSFVYGTFVYKFKIGYERPLNLHSTTMHADTLIDELAFLISFRKAWEAAPNEALKECEVDCNSVQQVVHLLVRCDVFEDFCIRLLNDSELSHIVSRDSVGEARLSPGSFDNIDPNKYEVSQTVFVGSTWIVPLSITKHSPTVMNAVDVRQHAGRGLT